MQIVLTAYVSASNSEPCMSADFSPLYPFNHILPSCLLQISPLGRLPEIQIQPSLITGPFQYLHPIISSILEKRPWGPLNWQLQKKSTRQEETARSAASCYTWHTSVCREDEVYKTGQAQAAMHLSSPPTTEEYMECCNGRDSLHILRLYVREGLASVVHPRPLLHPHLS